MQPIVLLVGMTTPKHVDVRTLANNNNNNQNDNHDDDRVIKYVSYSLPSVSLQSRGLSTTCKVPFDVLHPGVGVQYCFMDAVCFTRGRCLDALVVVALL